MFELGQNYFTTNQTRPTKVNQNGGWDILLTGTHVPTRISAPAAARDFAIAQPYPLSSATPAIKALLPGPKAHIVNSLKNYLFGHDSLSQK